MANQKVSNLQTAVAITPATDFLYLSQGGTDRKLPFSAIGLDEMNDYERLSFTPTLVFSTPGTSSTSSSSGVYVKIGKLVTFALFIRMTKGTGSGDATLGGLPFTNRAKDFAASVRLSKIGLASHILYVSVKTNSTILNTLFQPQSTSTVTNLKATHFSATNADMYVAGHYEIT